MPASRYQRALALFTCLCALLALPVAAKADVDTAVLESTAIFLQRAVPSPTVAATGGEWTVLGLARSGLFHGDQYFDTYYNNLLQYVSACKGVLSERKYTEYSRVVLALAAIGKDPRDVLGYDLLLPLGDFERTVWQGLNGPIWALIALDSGGYAMPENQSAKTQATRQLYVDAILEGQQDDGGFSLSKSQGSDPDLTGMALQALSRYQDQEKVKTATERALSCLSRLQQDNGGFKGWGGENVESTVQAIVALCELGIPLDDSRFVKSGKTLLDNLMSYSVTEGGFRHSFEGEVNLMATEQAFYTLVAISRMQGGGSSLYTMDDVGQTGASASPKPGEGLGGKHKDVTPQPVQGAASDFADIKGHEGEEAIVQLAIRGIVSGKGDGVFEPDSPMSRAEFCAIVVRSLGLAPKENGRFTDVVSGSWYAPYVGAANAYGIVNGVSSSRFNPQGQITRQEAAAMLARAAALCGMDADIDAQGAASLLAIFDDYRTVSDWAKGPLAFCYSSGIFSDSAMEIEPNAPILRAEMAQALYRMLGLANLLPCEGDAN